MEIILSFIVTWAPSVTAILAVVSTVLIAVKKTKDAVDAFKDDTTMKQLKQELRDSISQNETIKEQNDIIIDELTKIKDYRQSKSK